LDSTEPLEDAMRVVGALYGVTLVVANDDRARESVTRPEASKDNPSPNRKRRRRTTNARTQRTPDSSDGFDPEASTGSPAPTSAEASQQDLSIPSPAVPSNRQLRSWARENGFSVNDRGRVPTSAVTAFRDAHGK
jgi:hypothetical protein